jgi:hypothetical protein
LLAAATLAAFGPARAARGQVSIGLAYPGVPFLFYTPQFAPSPTDYLYQRDLARIATAANAIQQDAAINQVVSAYARTNAYYNHVRDNTTQKSAQSASRSRRPRRTAQPTPEKPARPQTVPLDAFFLPSGELDWPDTAPSAGGLASARAEAALAVKTVRDEVHAQGRAQAGSVDAAKTKLVAYGQQALGEAKSARSVVVADVFHYFLLLLYQSLDHAADPPAP